MEPKARVPHVCNISETMPVAEAFARLRAYC